MRKQVTLYLNYVQMRSSPKTKISQLHYGIYYLVSGPGVGMLEIIMQRRCGNLPADILTPSAVAVGFFPAGFLS
jgi:hypothetical protein